MSQFKPQVYMDHSNRSCIAVGTDIGGVEIVSLTGEGVGFTVIPDAAFAETWTASDYDLDRALERYAKLIENNKNNHPEAVARIQALIAERKGEAPAAAQNLLDASASQSSVAQAPDSSSSAVAVAPVAAETTVSPVVTTEKEPQVSDLNATAAPSTTASTETAAAPAPAAPEVVAPVAPVAPVVSPAPAAPVAAPAVALPAAVKPEASLDDSDVDANYSVTVNGGSVVVAMGNARPRRPDETVYAGREQVVVNQPSEPKFIVALDNNGVLSRVISVNDADRKVTGALTGGWVADGFTISTVTLKELAKLVGAARKVHEPKKGPEPGSDQE